MRSADDDHAVLNAVESQLRTEDPQIIACFMAFNSVTRPARPPDDWDQSSADESLPPEDQLRHRHVVQLVIIVCTLAAIIAGIAMSLLTGPQST
ncbi:MAG: hypothetical protein JWM19_1417 [Actinomycetia bacterium]|jgi:hypothetical protein|nr:hypothetical protein [Actinomycetes bacterium]